LIVLLTFPSRPEALNIGENGSRRLDVPRRQHQRPSALVINRPASAQLYELPPRSSHEDLDGDLNGCAEKLTLEDTTSGSMME
jgi:hypothetical protein